MPPAPNSSKRARKPAVGHAHIAATLRARIADGTYTPGLPLPSEMALAKEFGVARATVQKAIEMLRAEGLVHTEPRRGTYVQPTRPKRRIEMSRYQEELDHALADLESALDPTGLPPAEVTDSTADETLAALFGVPTGTRLICRYWVSRTEDGFPGGTTTSYLRWSPHIEVGSVANRLKSAGGVVACLVAVDQQPTDIVESTVARLPTDHESTVLRVGSSPVFATTRQMLAGDEVVEVGREIVVSARGTEMISRIQLQPKSGRSSRSGS